MKFWDHATDPLCFPTPLPDCRYHVSFSRYSLLSFTVVEKPNKINVSVFGPQFLSEGTTPTFLRQILSAIYCPSFGLANFGWVQFADLRLRTVRSLPMRWNAEVTDAGWWLPSNLKRLWTKVYVVLRRCRRPLVVCNALARLFMSCLIPKI